MRIHPIAIVLALSLTSPLAAQSKAPANPFASGRDLTCSFPLYAAVRWNGGTDGAPIVVSNTQEFAFQIKSIDLKKRNALFVAGDNASTLVSILLTPVALQVIEQTPIGNLNVTSIFVGGAENGTFLAVHSRHIGDPSAPPAVSQAYGTCSFTAPASAPNGGSTSQ